VPLVGVVAVVESDDPKGQEDDSMPTLTETITETATAFFEACETGKGWEGCKQYCHPDATFSAQVGALAGIDSLEAYT
jgi:hypothetical protein